jgi:hypothetical protein
MWQCRGPSNRRRWQAGHCEQERCRHVCRRRGSGAHPLLVDHDPRLLDTVVQSLVDGIEQHAGSGRVERVQAGRLGLLTRRDCVVAPARTDRLEWRPDREVQRHSHTAAKRDGPEVRRKHARQVADDAAGISPVVPHVARGVVGDDASHPARATPVPRTPPSGWCRATAAT